MSQTTSLFPSLLCLIFFLFTYTTICQSKESAEELELEDEDQMELMDMEQRVGEADGTTGPNMGPNTPKCEHNGFGHSGEVGADAVKNATCGWFKPTAAKTGSACATEANAAGVNLTKTDYLTDQTLLTKAGLNVTICFCCKYQICEVFSSSVTKCVNETKCNYIAGKTVACVRLANITRVA